MCPVFLSWLQIAVFLISYSSKISLKLTILSFNHLQKITSNFMGFWGFGVAVEERLRARWHAIGDEPSSVGAGGGATTPWVQAAAACACGAVAR